MRVLITGGAGAIGRHLVEKLVYRGASVIVLDNLFRTISSLDLPELRGAQCFKADIRDYDSIVPYFSGVHSVIHLAAHSNVRGAEQNPEYCLTTNVGGTENVVRASIASNVRHVVFASSREVYGDVLCTPVAEEHVLQPVNVYGRSKLMGEQVMAQLAQEGVQSSVIRLSNVVCPVDEGRVLHIWKDQAATGHNLTLFGGHQQIDFVADRTVIRTILKILEHGPVHGPVNVGGGRSYSLFEVAERICQKYGVNIHVEPAKPFEVIRYEADITRLRTLLYVDPYEDGDPLDVLWETSRHEQAA